MMGSIERENYKLRQVSESLLVFGSLPPAPFHHLHSQTPDFVGPGAEARLLGSRPSVLLGNGLFCCGVRLAERFLSLPCRTSLSWNPG